MHATLPLLVLYLPVIHPVQTPPSGPENPALQVQATRTELELGEFEFVGQPKHTDAALALAVVEYVATPQSVQRAFPLTVLYLPATHPVQTPPFGPENPALQVQATRTELELGELELEGQVWQVDAVPEPTVPEYVPDPQSVHAALPLTSLYFPAAHAVHEPAAPVVPAAHAVEMH